MTLPSERRLVMLGQAGDRDDAAIRELARAALALRPDRVVAKEMDAYLRGRAPGEVPGLIADELRRAGLPEGAISTPGGEVAGGAGGAGVGAAGGPAGADAAPGAAEGDGAAGGAAKQGWKAGQALSARNT